MTARLNNRASRQTETVPIKHMQLQHEVRASKFGVSWDIVDLRRVYMRSDGVCGICGTHVGINEFTIDHIIPLSRGGAHVFSNLQVAHARCNTSKGNR